MYQIFCYVLNFLLWVKDFSQCGQCKSKLLTPYGEFLCGASDSLLSSVDFNLYFTFIKCWTEQMSSYLSLFSVKLLPTEAYPISRSENLKEWTNRFHITQANPGPPNGLLIRSHKTTLVKPIALVWAASNSAGAGRVGRQWGTLFI